MTDRQVLAQQKMAREWREQLQRVYPPPGLYRGKGSGRLEGIGLRAIVLSSQSAVPCFRGWRTVPSRESSSKNGFEANVGQSTRDCPDPFD